MVNTAKQEAWWAQCFDIWAMKHYIYRGMKSYPGIQGIWYTIIGVPMKQPVVFFFVAHLYSQDGIRWTNTLRVLHDPYWEDQTKPRCVVILRDLPLPPPPSKFKIAPEKRSWKTLLSFQGGKIRFQGECKNHPHPKWWALEKVTPTSNMAIFGIYARFLGCSVFLLFCWETLQQSKKSPTWPTKKGPPSLSIY